MSNPTNSSQFHQNQVSPSHSRALIVPEMPVPVLDGGNPNTATNGAIQNERELLYNVEIVLGRIRILEDDIQKFDLKIKHHEANLEFLKCQSNSLDKSIKDLEGGLVAHRSSRKAETNSQNHENVQSEKDTIDQILKEDKKASSVLCREKSLQAAGCTLSKDILGIVAMLGKAPDDNLSRLFSEYLGSENMLAIVCKTYEGIKALESYDTEAKINIVSGIHGVGTITGKPVSGRFLAICLEDLRPYVGKLVAGDPQKRLDLLKPRLPDGTHPLGFIDFAVNMVHVNPAYLTCVTSSGYGLRETLFYELFSQLQVYWTRKEMELALPCISDGALSLDGGIIRTRGMISLGQREEVEVRFSVSLPASSMSLDMVESEERLRLMIWNKERIDEDIRREKSVLDKVRSMYTLKREEFMKFLDQSAPLMSKDLLGQREKC
ncbi:protein DEFECTIVE IN MERISTEM SILENCING 3-like isoform X2 [Nymphaea colorata]|uniref:protein DEFECTIVE IN MERISTEM SILENCING 3-like isoform X2 n=1 Tax=Nymphaea colorata TaxID=210225 RepID=UPI00129D313D|nr:protein DEFECTIVE IN MERISTEM SILENCING 3-like isoform X2 [Nymphaea colorata]